MITDDIFVANLDGESKTIIKVKKQPTTYGIIEKEYSDDKNKFVFSIIYYWNGIYQGKLYDDVLENAKTILKDVLRKVLKQTLQIKTFEQFNSENK